MSSDTIWKRLRQRPFAPFKIVVGDGSSHEVRDPETILIGKQVIHIGLFEKTEVPGEEPPSRFVAISPLHVTSVVDIAERRGNTTRRSA